MSQSTTYRPRPNTYRIDNIFIDEYAHRIGPLGVAVYNVLSRHADRDSGRCRVGIAKISQKLNLSRTSVKKYLHLLFAEGLIAIIPQYHRQGGQTANHYLLLDISPEGRARRLKQLNNLLRGTIDHPKPGGSSGDLPPAKHDHLATGGRSPDDPIQPSSCQDIYPRSDEDDLPAIQRDCPHPPRQIHRLSDGITICHRCYKQLSTAASETPAPAPPAAPHMENAPDPERPKAGDHAPHKAPNPDTASGTASEEDASEAT